MSAREREYEGWLRRVDDVEHWAEDLRKEWGARWEAIDGTVGTNDPPG
jgi:hypothetical protein